MNKRSGNSLFSLLLLLLFTLCSFFLLFVQMQGYQTMNNENERISELHIPIAYLSNKVRSFDEEVSIDENGYLKMQNKAMTLWIYEYQGSVYELYSVNNHPMHPEEGEKLFAVQSFSVEKKNHQILFRLTVNEQEEQFVIGLRSGY